MSSRHSSSSYSQISGNDPTRNDRVVETNCHFDVQSNRNCDALKRRCLYHWIGFPAPEAQLNYRARLQGGKLSTRIVAAVNRLRDMDLTKPPGVAETLDWATALDAVGAEDLSEEHAADTLGAVLVATTSSSLERRSAMSLTVADGGFATLRRLF